MKVYSDILDEKDFHEACPGRVHLAVFEQHPRPRKRSRGWTIGLTGTSPYTSQLSREKAATWDEHGFWMAELFRRDPDAEIGIYKGAQDFNQKTDGAYAG